MRLLLSVADRRQRAQVTKALKSAGVTDIVNSGEGMWLTDTWPDLQVDAVVAILSGARGESAAVFLDIGFARALKRPLLVMTDEPSFSDVLPDLTVILGGLQNTSALTFHLETFVESVRRPLAEPISNPEPWTLSTAKLRSELADVRKIRDPAMRASLFEQLVEHLLRSGGANVVAQDRYGKGQFDFVVSVSGTDFASGPIAVECKVGGSAQVISNAARKLQNSVLDRGAALGVVVFDEQALQSPYRGRSIPMVVTIGIDELMAGLQNKSLGRVLVDARNRAVHEL